MISPLLFFVSKYMFAEMKRGRWVGGGGGGGGRKGRDRETVGKNKSEFKAFRGICVSEGEREREAGRGMVIRRKRVRER